MRVLTILALLVNVGMVHAAEHRSQNLRLSVLQKPCSIETKWIGAVPRLPEAAMLTCGGENFLITGPSNLLGHVSITSPSDALEFVRFFTSPTTYEYFDMGGMVELVPGDVTEKSEFNVVDRKTFEKLLTPAEAHESVAGKREFQVKRTVVLDQRVYEIIEVVRADGLYTLVSKRELVADATKIGVMHFGKV